MDYVWLAHGVVACFGIDQNCVAAVLISKTRWSRTSSGRMDLLKMKFPYTMRFEFCSNMTHTHPSLQSLDWSGGIQIFELSKDTNSSRNLPVGCDLRVTTG
jgi:hypothetical protein